ANIDSQRFEFRFDRSDFWADPILTVRVRPKNESLDRISDVIGGRLDPCPARSDGWGDFLPQAAEYSEKTAGTLIFRFIVSKTSTDRCFYFWSYNRGLPGGDVWRVNVDSPLVQSRRPQSGRR